MQSEKFCSVFKSTADLFGVLSNMDRIRILALLLDEPKGVSEIHKSLNISQPRVSQSLKKLKLYHIIAENKKGKHVYYSLKDEKVAEIIEKVFELKSVELSTGKKAAPALKELTQLWHEKIQNERV